MPLLSLLLLKETVSDVRNSDWEGLLITPDTPLCAQCPPTSLTYTETDPLEDTQVPEWITAFKPLKCNRIQSLLLLSMKLYEALSFLLVSLAAVDCGLFPLRLSSHIAHPYESIVK